MPDPYVQKTLIFPYGDGTPAAYGYIYIASPTGVFSDTVKGDQYWFWDQSAANYALALVETSFHTYVPTVPNPTPGTPPATWFGAMYGGPAPLKGMSLYGDQSSASKLPPPFNPPPPPPTYTQPGAPAVWWFDPVIIVKPKPAIPFSAPGPTGGVKPYLY